MENNRALFIKYPRRINDLMSPHMQNKEKVFKIMKVIYLDVLDFENFSEDMTVDRLFIYENYTVCKSENRGCLAVMCKERQFVILVIPDVSGYVVEAAYIDIKNAF